MRLLHVSDWHVGLTTGVFARRRDHEAIVAEIAAIVRDRSPDLILHTGDLFHSQYPGVDDMRFGIEALLELSALAPMVVVRGNHDSDRLFSVFDSLLGASSRLRFIATPANLGDETVDPIRRYEAADGSRIALAAIPFVHANRFLAHMHDADQRTSTFADRLGFYERNLGAILLKSLDAARDVAIFASHQYIGGALKSGSERPLHVADEYATRATDLPSVSYAAFGHIHRPQLIPAGCIARYAGSPIQIDFGEEGERKSVVFVDARPMRAPLVEIISLSGGRELKTISVDFDAIASLAPRVQGALCRLTVRTQTAVPELATLVAEALPGAEFVEIVEDCAATRTFAVESGKDAARRDEATLADLFAEYLTGRPPVRADARRVNAEFERLRLAADAGIPFNVPELELGET
jgi:exonuclease SbcD